jgi:hypothetical protein
MSRVRRAIPKSVKDAVWRKYFGEKKPYGKCDACEKRIHYQDFEVGHNVPASRGGTDNISNLRPICGTCNRSMGTLSIEDFKEKYFGDLEKKKRNHDILKERKKEKLIPFTGRVECLEFKSGKKLYITMPHKPEDAAISFTIESLFLPYLDKTVSVAIEEIKE